MMMVLERTFLSRLTRPETVLVCSKTVAVRQYSIANFDFAFVAMLKGY
jgi:hypothetical protein